MNGRRSLMLVSALTVASLLLGGGALNALAERGGGGNGDHHGVGQGTSEHAQQPKPAVTDQANRHEDANAQKHEDDNVQRQDDDNEDLVTPPARVTDEDRPGLGCGDDNHTHTGAPGNPDQTCKPHDAGDDDQDVTTNDTSAAGVAAAADDRDGD